MYQCGELACNEECISENLGPSCRFLILLFYYKCNNLLFLPNKFYEQVEEAAMGSLVSPIVANLYMEYFEGKALQSASCPPRYWFRFVDDTWVI